MEVVKSKSKSKSKTTFKSSEPKIGEVNIDSIKAREVESLKQQEKERQQSLRDRFIENNLKLIGGINGKEIYKKVTKLFPLEEIQIRNESIVIFNSFKINKPYQINNVEIIKDKNALEKEDSIEFVKRIVVDVNSKIAGG